MARNTPENGMDRRNFLGRVALGVAACACAGQLAGCASLNPNARLFEAMAEGGRIALGAVGDFKIGAELKVVARALPGPVLVARVAEDEFRAVAMTCTHFGSELALVAAQRRFRCTGHGAEFAFDGSVLRGPASNPVAEYAVAREEDQVYLIVPS